MLVLFSKEKILSFLELELRSWEHVGGGPSIDAFSIDPREADPALLKKLGYYENKEAWLAGARIKEIHALINEVNSLPMYQGKK